MPNKSDSTNPLTTFAWGVPVEREREETRLQWVEKWMGWWKEIVVIDNSFKILG